MPYPEPLVKRHATDPAAAFTVAWSDPPPKPVPAGTPFCCDVTGAWSTYWYDGELYESPASAAPEPADPGVLLPVEGLRSRA